MSTIVLLLLIASVGVLAGAAFGRPSRVNLVALGLALFVLTFLLPALRL